MSELAESSRAQKDNATAGIAWMVASTAILMGVHGSAKYLVAEMPVVQVVWARFAFHLLLAVLLLAPYLARVVRSRNLKLQLLRSGVMALGALSYFAGLRFVPLADAVAIMFLCPIMVAALAAPLLGETVGMKRWLGVACGFAGALIIVRPGSGLFGWGVGLILLAAFGNALYQLSTRKLGASDDPRTTLLFTPLVGTIGASLILPFEWETPDAQGWLLMGVIGGVACIGHFAIIKAYQLAPAAVAAPFAYLQLVWALVMGLTVFGDWPDVWTFAGAAVIAGSGLYVLHRERLAKRDGPPAS